jgi:ATP-dependent RNA helicase DeaD
MLAVKRLIDFNPKIYGFDFCRTSQETATVAEKLAGMVTMLNHFTEIYLKHNVTDVMERFRKKILQILVATDVAASGLDIDNITHVINYQFTR